MNKFGDLEIGARFRLLRDYGGIGTTRKTVYTKSAPVEPYTERLNTFFTAKNGTDYYLHIDDEQLIIRRGKPPVIETVQHEHVGCTGQLYEPCPICGAEPVCRNCGYCDRHGKCAEISEDRATTLEIERSDPGFWDRLSRYQEDSKWDRGE